MDEKIWFYENEKGKEGPYTEVDLVKMIKNNIIKPDDMIWTFALENWIKLKDSVYVFYTEGDLNDQKIEG